MTVLPHAAVVIVDAAGRVLFKSVDPKLQDAHDHADDLERAAGD
jgi:hypothetical protein